jgi:hypothetical protein
VAPAAVSRVVWPEPVWVQAEGSAAQVRELVQVWAAQPVRPVSTFLRVIRQDRNQLVFS